MSLWEEAGLGCRCEERAGVLPTSESSLSVSSSTFTVRMKARCASTWRSASRKYFLWMGVGAAGHTRAALWPFPSPPTDYPVLFCPDLFTLGYSVLSSRGLSGRAQGELRENPLQHTSNSGILWARVMTTQKARVCQQSYRGAGQMLHTCLCQDPDFCQWQLL